MRRPDQLLDGTAGALATSLASGLTRRSFLARVGGAMLTLAGGSAVAAALKPSRAEAFHFCGHIWTTGSCPAPYKLPRIDPKGLPLRPSDGLPVDNLGRLIDASGYPVDETGARLTGPDGRLLERGPRTRICEDWVPERFGIEAVTQGAWYRCCEGQVRKLVDCCSKHRRRINGDDALVGYCYTGRRVFCVMYLDTGLPC